MTEPNSIEWYRDWVAELEAAQATDRAEIAALREQVETWKSIAGEHMDKSMWRDMWARVWKAAAKKQNDKAQDWFNEWLTAMAQLRLAADMPDTLQDDYNAAQVTIGKLYAMVQALYAIATNGHDDDTVEVTRANTVMRAADELIGVPPKGDVSARGLDLSTECSMCKKTEADIMQENARKPPRQSPRPRTTSSRTGNSGARHGMASEAKAGTNGSQRCDLPGVKHRQERIGRAWHEHHANGEQHRPRVAYRAREAANND
ncbi:MAG: hypothetical protein ACYTBJ_18730 [Planctomycetota bacterium]|jgi:hypothetical protein